MQLYFKHITLSILCFLPSLASPSQPLSYAAIGNMMLQAEPTFKQGDIVGSNWHAPELQEAPHITDIDLTIKTENSLEQIRLIFLLLNTFLPIHIPPSDAVIGADDLRTLHIVSSLPVGGRALLTLFPTQTLCGKAIVAKKLAIPLSHRESIEKNQKIVAAFVREQRLHREIKQILAGAAVQESTIISLFETSTALTKKVFNRLYWGDPESDTSIKKMAAWHGYQVLATDPKFAVPRIALSYAYTWACTKAFQYLGEKTFSLQKNVNILEKFNEAEESAWLGTRLFTVKQKDTWNLCKTQFSQLNKLDTTYSRIALFITALQEITIKYFIGQANRTLSDDALSHMKTKLFVMNHFIEQTRALKNSIDSSELLKTHFTHYEELQNFLEARDNPHLQKLFTILQTGTFHNQSSYFLDSPRILVAYKLLELCKEAFIHALAAYGELDALCAAAELYIQSYNNPHHFCFVEFSNEELPVIMLDGLWNPLMHPDEAIANTIHLGQGGDPNMIITGPNGSGKSVFMKSVALNLILAQSFGIAAASSAKLSVFDKFHIYLNIQENLELSLSTFMAEKKKMDEICKHVAQQPAGKKSFTLIDEGLKGTVEQSGGPHIYNAGRAMSNNPGNICLLATHFKKPTDLEQDTFGNFANYRLGLLEPHEGEFVRTFKLEKKKCDWWFENDAKRERFIAWLTSPTI